jgi:succinyl-CoA synthetase alpha subunit
MLSSIYNAPDPETVSQAMEKLKPDATGIYVAAYQAPGAIEEAIEAEVPLIVAVAEHIPIHNMLRVYSYSDLPRLMSTNGTRYIPC